MSLLRLLPFAVSSSGFRVLCFVSIRQHHVLRNIGIAGEGARPIPFSLSGRSHLFTALWHCDSLPCLLLPPTRNRSPAEPSVISRSSGPSCSGENAKTRKPLCRNKIKGDRGR